MYFVLYLLPSSQQKQNKSNMYFSSSHPPFPAVGFELF